MVRDGPVPTPDGNPPCPPAQGLFRIIKNQRGGDPSPKTPSPPPQTKANTGGSTGTVA